MKCPTCGNDPVTLVNGQFLVNANALNGCAEQPLIVTNVAAGNYPNVVRVHPNVAGCAAPMGMVFPMVLR